MLPSAHPDTHDSFSPQTLDSDAPFSADDAAEISNESTPNFKVEMLPSAAHLDGLDLSALPTVNETAVALPTESATSSTRPDSSSSDSDEAFGSNFSLKDDNLSAVTEPFAFTASIPTATDSIDAANKNAADKNADAANSATSAPQKLRLPTKLPVDFIDLYEVLEMPRDSKFPDLRKRIAEMYLDAQKNLDHRNAKKRLFYQQLFEVSLPEARHLLLDPERRIEYDKYLDDHREDQGHRALAESVLSNDAFAARAQSVEEVVEKARIEEEQLSPEELRARRVQLWQKWEQSLASANDPLAQLKFSMPELQQRSVERVEYMERALVEVTEIDRRRQEEAARRRQSELRAREEEERRAQEAHIEARRQVQYQDTVENLITTGRLYNGFGFGAAILVAGFAVLFYLEVMFSLPGRRYPLGSADSFRMVMLFLILIACGVGAWQGTMRGAARIKSLMRTPEAARQNADIAAAQIVTERFQRGTSSAQGAPDQYEVEQATREEALQQLRIIRRSSILGMMRRNAVAGWSFALGVGSLVICSGTVFLIDFTAKRGTASSGRASTVLIGLIVAVVISAALAYVGMRVGRNQQVKAVAME